MLLLVGFYDELWSGIAVVAAPEVEQTHAIDHQGYTLWVFAVPMLLASLIESPIALRSDSLDRGRLLRISLFALAASLALSACAMAPWQLALGLSIAGASSGVACACAQGALLARAKDGTDRAMSRWMVSAAAGDAVTPLVIGGVLALGGSYRVVLVLVAAMITLSARTTRDIPQHDEDDEERGSIREALATPRLWWMLAGVSACGLLDEIVIALASLRMTRDLHAGEGVTALALSACSLGAVLGAVVTDTLVARMSSRVVLVSSSILATAALLVLGCLREPYAMVPVLFVIGVAASAHYPLIMAAAYDAAPKRPGLVHAVANLFSALDLLLPLAIGFAAQRYGLVVAMLFLVAQPVAAIAIARGVRPAPP